MLFKIKKCYVDTNVHLLFASQFSNISYLLEGESQKGTHMADQI